MTDDFLLLLCLCTAVFFCSVYALLLSSVFGIRVCVDDLRVSGHTWVPDAGLIEGSACCSPRSSFSCAVVSSSDCISSSDRLFGVVALPAGGR